jgi:hypothetical protein
LSSGAVEFSSRAERRIIESGIAKNRRVIHRVYKSMVGLRQKNKFNKEVLIEVDVIN